MAESQRSERSGAALPGVACVGGVGLRHLRPSCLLGGFEVSSHGQVLVERAASCGRPAAVSWCRAHSIPSYPCRPAAPHSTRSTDNNLAHTTIPSLSSPSVFNSASCLLASSVLACSIFTWIPASRSPNRSCVVAPPSARTSTYSIHTCSHSIDRWMDRSISAASLNKAGA